MSLKKILYKTLLVVSLGFFAVSIFLPLLSESDKFAAAVIPPYRTAGQFWSYQAKLNFSWGDFSIASYLLRFHEFWFARESYVSDPRISNYYPHLWERPDIYRGWMLVFVFQLVTVAAGMLSLVKERVKGRPSLLMCVVSSGVTLALGCYQFLQHSSWDGLGWLRVNVEAGFFLVPISFILWLISLLIYTRG